MRPSFAIDDQVYGSVPHTKTAGDGSLAFAALMSCSDIADRVFRKRLCVAPAADRMGDVLFMGNSKKVCGRVIGPIKISMMDIGEPERVWDESGSNQSADEKGLLFPILAEDEMLVPSPVRGADDNLSSLEPAYPPQVGYFVKSLVAHNGLPSFVIGHGDYMTHDEFDVKEAFSCP